MALGKKTGGRKKGTPNKENPLKGYLRTHSLDYFTPKQRITDTGGTYMASDFDLDMLILTPDERVNAELRLLRFHTPEMKAIDMDMTLTETTKTIEERLAELAGDDESSEE